MTIYTPAKGLPNSCRTLLKKLQNNCQEFTTKMIECLSFVLQCTTVILFGAAAYCLYSLLEMDEESINELFPEVSYKPLESDVKPQKLIECILTGNSKQCLRKAYIKRQINKLSAEKVDKLFSNYEAKLSSQMVKSLGKQLSGCIRLKLMPSKE